MERLAERAPILAVIEDMHWADLSTLDLVAFLMCNLRQGRIALVCSPYAWVRHANTIPSSGGASAPLTNSMRAPQIDNRMSGAWRQT